MDTTVPYERTKAEIEILLKSYGVKGIRWTSMEGQEDLLEFVIEAEVQGVKKQLGIAVRPPHIYIKKKIRGQIVNTENINQEYRLLFHWIKSKIEAVVWGLSTIEKEFLSEILMKLPNGEQTTVGEIVIGLVGQNQLQSLPFYSGNQPTQLRPQPMNVTDKKIIDVEASQ
jgi:hypothetical protein